MKRIVVAISGASGLLLAHSLLTCLSSPGIQDIQEGQGLELHLVISAATHKVAEHETNAGADVLDRITRLAHYLHDPMDFAAPMASGSWRHEGMIICPCSMSSLSAIAAGYSANLIHRAASVCLKERFPLILVPRETPLSRIHIKNMLAATEAGAIIMPPCPAYYANITTLEEAARHFCVRILDQLGLPGPTINRWQ
jgi:4-hydroxy-3-polyprenylbenzoate decarboxylase